MIGAIETAPIVVSDASALFGGKFVPGMAERVDEQAVLRLLDAKNVKDANTDTIQSTYDDLKKAVQNRPTEKPVTQQISGLTPQLTAFAEAWKKFASSLDCKSSS